jgi:uncharacterized protein involved in exopolysaccharide biosynthesis
MTPTPDNNDELYIDSSLLKAVARRRWKLWAFTGLIIFALIVAVMMLFIQQSYTSTTSLSIQNSASPMGGALSALTGQSQNKKYLGILNSRRLAEAVSRDVNLFHRLPFRDHDDMVEKLQGMVSAKEDPTDGLVYVSVTVKGPPYIRLFSKLNRHKVQVLAKDIANAYALELRKYYVENDNARDTVLLRGANELLQISKDNYYHNRAVVMDFIKKHLEMTYDGAASAGASSLSASDLSSSASSSDVSMPALASSSTGASMSASGGSSGMVGMYQSLMQIETELRGTEAGHSVYNAKVNSQLRNINNLPEEDPLLVGARKNVLEQKMKLAQLRIQLGDMHPLVIAAKNELEVAEAQLNREMKGVKDQYTTDSVSNSVKVADLEAKRKSLLSHIRVMEKKMMFQGLESAKFDELKTDLMLSLAAFKETEVDAAKLRLETVSAQSRVSIVDTADTSKIGNPRPRIMLGAALALVFVGVFAFVIRDYTAELKSKKNTAAAEPSAS